MMITTETVIHDYIVSKGAFARFAGKAIGAGLEGYADAKHRSNKAHYSEVVHPSHTRGHMTGGVHSTGAVSVKHPLSGLGASLHPSGRWKITSSSGKRVAGGKIKFKNPFGPKRKRRR